MTSAVLDKGPAIVTGASQGIGASIAERLAHDGYGVIVNYAADAEGAEAVVSAINAKGGRAVAVRADVASEDDVAAMFDRAHQLMGPQTALVNNAGSPGKEARIDEQEADELTRLMQCDVVGPMLCAKSRAGSDRQAATNERVGHQIAQVCGTRLRHTTVLARPIPDGGLELGGNQFRAVEVGHTDTDDTTLAYVPPRPGRRR